ncbi:S41 family peptidase [Streptomyces sp. NPDC088775]|uniref:S41 family peptidase n=1 Tax=Streptomyces sp. NPDC088775 TaxID=3365896 RepID=UPI0037F6A872
MVAFLHPGGAGRAWQEGFENLVARLYAGGPSSIDDAAEAVHEALRVLGDGLTCVLPAASGPHDASGGATSSDGLGHSVDDGSHCLRAVDYAPYEYDHQLAALLRSHMHGRSRSGKVVVDLSGASWWFLRQFSRVLPDFLDSTLELPQECGRLTSGIPQAEFEQSGGPWAGVVHLESEEFRRSSTTAPLDVTLLVRGFGAYVGRLAHASAMAGARIVRIGTDHAPFGNCVRIAGPGSTVLRIRSSWIETDAELAGGTIAPRAGKVSDVAAHARSTAPRAPSLRELSGLLRLSGFLRYFYPYTDNRLDRALHVLDAATYDLRSPADTAVLTRALHAALAELADTHAHVHEQNGHDLFGHAVENGLFEVHHKTVRMGRATGELAALPAGTHLLEIDGCPVETRIATIQQNHSHSSDQARAWLVERHLLGDRGEHVRLLLATPDGREVTMRARTSDVLPAPRPGVRRTPDGVVIIDLAWLSADDHRSVDAALQEALGIIVDLRGYATGAAWQCLQRLAWRRERVACFERRELRGIGPAVSTRSRHESQVSPHPHARPLPVIGLINHRTISRSEYMALLLRAGTDCDFVGTPSAGCVGNVAHFRLTSSAVVTFTGQKTLDGRGREIMRKGILPDIWMDPEEMWERNEEDPCMEKARTLIREKNG